MPNSYKSREIGARLALTRLALGYRSQISFLDALAPEMVISQQRWNAYERGRSPITVPVSIALTRRFGLTLDWIYFGDRMGLDLRLVRALEAVERADSATAEAAASVNGHISP